VSVAKFIIWPTRSGDSSGRQTRAIVYRFADKKYDLSLGDFAENSRWYWMIGPIPIAT
jgi:hypothetical protein